MPRMAALHLGAQGLRLPHLFQRYVSLDTSAFRYAMRSAVRGIALALSLSSSLLNLSFLWLPPHAQPASQPSPAHVPFPWSQARLGWEANDNKQPPQPGRFLPGEEMGTWCRGGGAGAASSNRLVWLGGEVSRPRGANEHCATGVSSSVPSLPCLRREQAAATTQRLARRSLRPARSGTRRR